MLSKAALACAALAVALAGYALYRHSTDVELPPGQALVIDEPDAQVGEHPAGSHVLVTYRVRNRTGEPVRVLGFAPCCGRNACMGPKSFDQFVVPARGIAEFVCDAHGGGEPGPFETPTYLNFFDRGIHHLKVTAKGTWTEPRGTAHAAAP